MVGPTVAATVAALAVFRNVRRVVPEDSLPLGLVAAICASL
jgi:hypothetical protein